MNESMNALNFLDANVWLALLWSRHVHSERAKEWFDSSEEEQFFFCRFTQLTVLRLLTTESIMGKDVRNLSQAWELWDKIWADPRIAFLPEPENLETELRAHTRLTRSHLINALGGSRRKRAEPSQGNSLGSIPSE
jgi:predicted nucleic acid-binding protein